MKILNFLGKITLGKITGGDNRQNQIQANNQLLDSVANLQPYGIASHTPKDAPALAIFTADQRIVILAGSPKDAPEAKAGEVIIYAKAGQKITLNSEGITIEADEVKIEADSIKIGKLEITPSAIKFNQIALAKVGDAVSTPTGPGTITGGA